ncbi:ABC transporter ATP-binding protein [Candidatus Phytoplasma citri]|uniref:ABC transporter ATP-binding protein/permease n=1 Tax=Candidatus Phytoplasma citri TaxID=180978 RepID=A0A1S9M1C6_9MOLU|nr:ABC transporter ATP-binding protein [Candidatus Phytoplasma aurantifolia]MDO8060196.1 ABC transporter ATP-binding protein/permease [Candidatus Phytoplasma aurantifolia]MDO8078683.1 ABC transporter ATP-binding protein/permease [Candidatus Phytoplasma aurantifolia]OOP58903.1 multidrug ABC transporter ATP-binding protein [Candidatus Phytoplasma aurantifolia]
MKLIFKYIMRYKIILFLNILAVLFIASGEIGIPLIIGRYVIDNPVASQNFLFFTFSLLLLVLCAILGNLIINFCSAKTSSLIFKDLNADIFKKIQTFSIIEMKNLGVPFLMNCSITCVGQIVNFMASLYRALIVAPIMLIISLILIYRIYMVFSYIVLSIIPLLVIIFVCIIFKNYLLSTKKQKFLEKINSKVRENLTGIKVIKSLNTENYEGYQFDKINSKYALLNIHLFNSIFSMEPLFYLLLNISIIFTTGFGAYILKTGTSNDFHLGGLYNCINLQYHILYSILNFLLLFTMFPKALVSLRKIEYLLNIKPSIKNNLKYNLTLSKPIVSLEFKNVYFQYSNDDKMILSDINFKVKTSELIAVVGSTGSGKSTLINLIPRLIDPTKGCLLINGVDIKLYNLISLRDKIGVVSQKNILFKGTIFSNLSFGKSNANSEEILECAKISQSYDFINKTKCKLQEPVSELGSNFSGGQKQRLAITKVLLKKPDIYIFDDSFSALDYQTDLTIRKNLSYLRKNSIIIIVAQRLSSILNADKIIVLDDGKIIDIGKHEELMNRCQIYKNIAFSQKIKEVLN